MFRGGHYKTLEKLLKSRPINEQDEATEKEENHYLLNDVDDEGNTPLHLGTGYFIIIYVILLV